MTNSATLVKTTIALGLAIAGLGIAAPAVADGDSAPTIEISAHGYDLTSANGIARLTERAHRTTRQVCGTSPSGDLAARAAERDCVAKAMASVNAQIEALRIKARDGMPGSVITANADTRQSPVTK